jgi:pyruvate formate lyase activating enzyme
MCCVEACAYGVHTILDIGSELVHQVDQMKCTGCGKCLEVCCYDALSLMGREYSPEELYEKIKGDLRYFLLEGMDTKENGGVTFSGGEPMLYYRFIRAFCRLIPGVHRAIETSGYVPKEYFKYILDSIDLFLFDYKISDSRKHKQYCGVDNALILKNLDYIYSENKKIVLRLPLIPELNDEDEHFDGIAELLLSHPEIKRAEIMAYHNLGIGKTKELGLPVHEELPAKDADAVLIKHWLESLKSRGCANVYQS